MKYYDYVNTFSQEEYCPFCNFTKEEIIDEGVYFFIILARSPYSLDHLLIVPKRHVVFLKELKKAELKELWALTEEWNEKLRQRHQGTSILVRDTLRNQGIGKSIDHFHLHIVPNRYIGIIKDEEREFFSDAQYAEEVKRMKSLYS